MGMATLFGAGKFPIMPGTIGSFFGLFYVVLVQHLRVFPAIFIMVFLSLAAVLICDIAEKKIGEKDPGCIILDEFVAMPVCFLGVKHFVPANVSFLLVLGLGFIIFRAFDILKPFGIRKTQNLSGGIGIVADDLLAAVYTNVVLSLICLTVL
jgi:phosphatidylglycerophosphatase A